jgi:hypothetical protein
MTPDALYAYAVVEAGATPPAAIPAILPGAGFALVPGGGCAALVSAVPRAPFQDGPAGQGGDPAWVTERAAAHHAVVSACTAAGATLPLAFGALFSGPAPLAAWLEARGTALRAALAHVAGCAEWTVRVEEDAAAHAAWLDAHDPALREVADRAGSAAAGTAYLLHRQRDRLRNAARAARCSGLRDRLAAALQAHAQALPEAMTALVARQRDAELRAEVARIGAEFAGSGLAPRLAGPWPPYAAAREAIGRG